MAASLSVSCNIVSWQSENLWREDLAGAGEESPTVRSRYQGTTGEDSAIIKCSHESCVKVINKLNLLSKTQSRVTQNRDSI
jgi:hypothetical protein